MALAKPNTKGRFVIPERVREQLGLSAGKRVEFLMTDADRLIRPSALSVTTLRGVLKPPKQKVSIKAMRRAVTAQAAALDIATKVRKNY